MKVTLVDRNLKNKFDQLNKNFRKWIDKVLDDLAKNPNTGIQIPKRLIPKTYTRKYGIRNLWKINLPSANRLLYTIAGADRKMFVIIIDWMSHKEYNRLFGYK